MSPRAPRVRLSRWRSAWAAAAGAAPFKVLLLERADDPRLERSRTERAYLGHPGGPAFDGIDVALQEAQFELDAAGASLDARAQRRGRCRRPRATAASRAEKAGCRRDRVRPAGRLAARRGRRRAKLPLLNVGDAADRLRERDCRARLLHLLPSERMRADALAQTLVARRWTQVLLLTGPSALDDRARRRSRRPPSSAMALKLVQSKPFKLSADPRERDLANPLLLTGSASVGSYDVVWVVDSDGEFARALPYRTALPRPVVGDAGLVALAWHAQFERFGAPQVSRRFAKAAGRPMTAHDWAAWMAGKALVAAAAAAPKGPGRRVREGAGQRSSSTARRACR